MLGSSRVLVLNDPGTREERAAAMAVEHAAAAVLASSLKLVGSARHCSPPHQICACRPPPDMGQA